MIERQIFKVLYSPVKAFEEIVENPDIKGPFLILALTLLATAGMQYVSASKMFIKTETPGEYVSLFTIDVFKESTINFLIGTSYLFGRNWLTYTFILFMIIKAFREETGPWRALFIVVGYTFVVTIIYALASTLLISTLPAVELPLKAWPPATEEEAKIVDELIYQTWSPTWAYKLGIFLNYTINLLYGYSVWTVALTIIAIRFLSELSWRKAISISAISYVIYFYFSAFLTTYLQV